MALTALLLLLPVSSLAAQSAADFSSSCQSSQSPLRSPEEVFKAHGISIESACPTQSTVDTLKECQESASHLQELYSSLNKKRADACRAASAAAAKAQQDCNGQSGCVEAQETAVKAYKAAVESELAAIKDYVKETDVVLKYANDRIAGGGVEIFHSVKIDNALNPGGKGGAADFMKATTNQDAVRAFDGEDESNARAVVQRFLKDGAPLSDITSIKSALIREPLQLVAAGTEWKRELVAYQTQVEGRSTALTQQAATLKTSGSNLGDSRVTGSTPSSQLGAASAGMAAASTAASTAATAATAAGQLASITQSAPSAGSGSAGNSASYSNASESAGAPAGIMAAATSYFSGGAPKQSASVQAGSGVGAGIASPGSQTVTAAVPGAADASGPGSTEGKTSGSGASSSLRAQLTARLAARASSGAGGDAATASADPGKEAGRDPASTGSAASSAPGSASAAGESSGSSASGELAPFTPALIPVVNESNENAVKGIVGAWEKTLSPDSAVASAPEMPGASSPALFGRVRLAHERALRRGSIQRTIAPKL